MQGKSDPKDNHVTGTLLSIRSNWRCVLWLPSSATEVATATGIFLLTLVLVPSGIKKFAPDTVVFDYSTPLPYVVAAVSTALNFFLVRQLTGGDYLDRRRFYLVTLMTWLVASIVTTAISFGLDVTPPIPSAQFSNEWITLLRIYLGGQLLLPFALFTSGAFKASPNRADKLRDALADAKGILANLRTRRSAIEHTEINDGKGNDEGDWDKLVGLLERFTKDGEALQQSLPCEKERLQATQIVGNAKAMLAAIKVSDRPNRNKLLHSQESGVGKARAFFSENTSTSTVT